MVQCYDDAVNATAGYKDVVEVQTDHIVVIFKV